jgi:hypothetical protein
MSENKQNLPESPAPGTDTQDDDPVNQSRRRLTGAGLGVSAIFTLASQPVWANQCTISGMYSGNISTPSGTPCTGCTHGYWKNHTAAWPAPFMTTDKFNAIFGVTEYKDTSGNEYTLLEVLNMQGNDDPVSPALGFQAVAGLLNAAHTSLNYGYTSGEFIILFKNHYLGGNPEALKNSIDLLNNRNCPLN